MQQHSYLDASYPRPFGIVHSGMKIAHLSLVVSAVIVFPVLAQSGSDPAAGNGPFVVPTSAAYAELTNAANSIVADAKATFPRATVAVLYDRQIFALVPSYETAVEQMQQIMAGLCRSEATPLTSHTAVPSLTDLGTAASGLAALVAVTLPAFSIQGQAVKIDNAALLSAFAASALAAHLTVVDPAYLLPATAANEQPLTCTTFRQNRSLAELWRAASIEADSLATNPASAAALTQYRKIAEAYLDSGKGESLLSKLLTAEALAKAFVNPSQVAVIDLHLDSVGVDSTTRTVLWWRSTRFSANILAHYSLLRAQGNQDKFSLTLAKTAAVNILLKNKNEKNFATSADPTGVINGSSHY